MKYAMLNPAGLPLALGEAEVAPEGSLILPETANLVRLMRQYLVDGFWQDRPTVILNRMVESPVTISLTEAPAEVAVRIFDVDADELLFEGPASPGDFWTFTDVGRYAVEVEPPAPWLPATLRFEVAP